MEPDPEERYTLQGRIGRGSFGEVFRGVDRTTQEVVAIKIIDLDQVRVVASCGSAPAPGVLSSAASIRG
jgi:serine/threonine protein kinase